MMLCASCDDCFIPMYQSLNVDTKNKHMMHCFGYTVKK